MAFLFELIRRNWLLFNPPKAKKEPSALRFGILGAARIAPNALIAPAKSHPDVVIAAVAARDESKARAYAKTHGIATVYHGNDGYQKLLEDPTIDCIYNPLPNGLHYEWTMRALAAGKHVLLEKPSCNTAEETRKIFELAQAKGLVCLEAFHFRFHPAFKRVAEIVQSGELGPVKSLNASLAMPSMFDEQDIRYNFDLGGGGMMDMGCYALTCVRALSRSEPAIVSATAIIASDARIDRGMTAILSFPNDVAGKIICDMALPRFHLPRIHATVLFERGELRCYNYVMPTFYHYIQVLPKDGNPRTEKVYAPPPGEKGVDWWSSYRHQLEAFVDKVRGREPAAWITAEDSIDQAAAVEKIYVAAQLPPRPSSSYVLP